MTNFPTVLVLDEDPDLCRRLLRSHGGRTLQTDNAEQALRWLEQEQDQVQIVFASCAEVAGYGLEFLRCARPLRPELPIILTSHDGSVAAAVAAMREGATDFLVKPFNVEIVTDLITLFVPPVRDAVGLWPGFIATDPRSRELLLLGERVAATDATVLLNGESGVGKEVLARFIHARSARADNPFVAVNCAAIPENMLEALLFGHERGAFTGAHEARPGKFELAQGGTLLLDEVSEMDLGLQGKLLRVLQEREVERLGGRRLLRLDVRVIATSNRELSAAVADGRFREDLFYRLSVFPLLIPPLRDRPKDILPLAWHFLRQHAGGARVDLSPAAIQRLQAHAWPGNVRELDNVMQRALILRQGTLIDSDSIRFDWVTPGQGSLGPQQTGNALLVQPSEPRAAESTGELNDDLRQREGALIIDALRRERGRRKEAAARLGISARTLRYKLARLREAGVAIP